MRMKKLWYANHALAAYLANYASNKALKQPKMHLFSETRPRLASPGISAGIVLTLLFAYFFASAVLKLSHEQKLSLVHPGSTGGARRGNAKNKEPVADHSQHCRRHRAITGSAANQALLGSFAGRMHRMVGAK